MGSLNITGRIKSLYALLDKAKIYEDQAQIAQLEREIADLKRQQYEYRPPSNYGDRVGWQPDQYRR